LLNERRYNRAIAACQEAFIKHIHPEWENADELGNEQPDKIHELSAELYSTYPEQGGFWLNDGTYHPDKCDGELHLIEDYQKFHTFDDIGVQWADQISEQKSYMTMATHQYWDELNHQWYNDEIAALREELWAIANDESIPNYEVYHRMEDHSKARAEEFRKQEREKEEMILAMFPNTDDAYLGDHEVTGQLSASDCKRIGTSLGIHLKELN